jgi:hypothetical protein
MWSLSLTQNLLWAKCNHAFLSHFMKCDVEHKEWWRLEQCVRTMVPTRAMQHSTPKTSILGFVCGYLSQPINWICLGKIMGEEIHLQTHNS